jgi:DNA-binding response OmpR family regulator
MAIAHLNSFRAPLTAVAPIAATPAPTRAPLQSVPTETEARGFALYVGLDEATAAAAGTSLAAVVAELRKTLENLLPGATEQTFAAVAIAPKGVGGKNIDVVRTALRDPRAVDRNSIADEDKPATGIVIDTLRKRVFADGDNAGLTHKEFELLNYLVENEGVTITRSELVELVWSEDDESAPNERTIDVHVRRLRAKISGYEDIIRTIRGGGYRFDRHPDVLIER